jgi:hypothetical protein
MFRERNGPVDPVGPECYTIDPSDRSVFATKIGEVNMMESAFNYMWTCSMDYPNGGTRITFHNGQKGVQEFESL